MFRVALTSILTESGTSTGSARTASSINLLVAADAFGVTLKSRIRNRLCCQVLCRDRTRCALADFMDLGMAERLQGEHRQNEEKATLCSFVHGFAFDFGR